MPTTRTCRVPACSTPKLDVREMLYRLPGDGLAADPIREVEFSTYICAEHRLRSLTDVSVPVRTRSDSAWREAYRTNKGYVFNAQVAREWAVRVGILPPTIGKTGRVPEAIIQAYAEAH